MQPTQNIKFTFETIMQGFVAARCDTWDNPAERGGFIPISNKDSRWIARVGSTTADVTKTFHDHETLSVQLTELVSQATDEAVKSLASSHARVVELESALKEATIVRNDNLKIAAASYEMTLRQVAEATRANRAKHDTGLSHQRVAQIVTA